MKNLVTLIQDRGSILIPVKLNYTMLLPMSCFYSCSYCLPSWQNGMTNAIYIQIILDLVKNQSYTWISHAFFHLDFIIQSQRLRLVGISGGHLVQPSAPSRANFKARADLAGFSPVKFWKPPRMDTLPALGTSSSG